MPQAHHGRGQTGVPARSHGRCTWFRTLAALTLGLAIARSESPKPTAATNTHWWALQPLRPTSVPELTSNPGTTPPLNPIDAFIRAKLAQHTLTPAPQADRRTLLRRVYFDLIGLPPSPEEVDAFLADTAPDAYDQRIRQLLDSPRYGERWARHWIDAVHFAETHGHDQDRIRTNAWPYRDYLIASLNADKPYPRFVQEQVAGDRLFPDDPQATIALGFLAAGPWDESSLRDIREDTLDRQIARYLDRDDIVTTVMQTFTSTTVQCARCHDHKFDPIPQTDYYRLQAVFAGTDKANRRYDPDPAVHRRRQALQAQLAALDRGDRDLLFAADTRAAVAQWEQARRSNKAAWRDLQPDTFLSVAGATLTRLPDGSILASGQHGPTDTYTLSARSPAARLTAIRLEVLTDPSLPHNGPGREPNGNLHLSEFQLLAFSRASNTPQRLLLRHPSADFNQDGWTITHALDGNDKTAWGIHPKVGQPHQAVFELAQPLDLAPDTLLSVVMRQLHGGHCIGRFRVSVTDAQPPAEAMLLPEAIEAVLAKAEAHRSEDERAALAAFVLRQSLTRHLDALPRPSWVFAGASDFEPDGAHKPTATPRAVHVLSRGEITKPGSAAQPGALSCVDRLPAQFALELPQDEGARRVALAQWLTHRDNPLSWRSIVNRLWHLHFSRGLVDTPNDFGRMGGQPSHPELLDWLALWFRDEARGSLKALHRLIVSSATYRQSSNTRTPVPSDTDNRLLWRMNRTRLDAEQVRDAVLLISDRLDLRMGGPSDQQFDLQPGIHVTPKVDYAQFDLDSPAGRRRSVYRFLFRTLPDPFMDALDCPAGDHLTPARTASVTVQQALALWNNAFLARHCEHFAARLAREAPTVETQVRRAFQLALDRSPTAEELREFGDYTRQHGLANLARLLFNSNEFLFVN